VYYYYYHESMGRYIELAGSVDRRDTGLDGKDFVKAFQFGGLLSLHFHIFISYSSSSCFHYHIIPSFWAKSLAIGIVQTI